MDDHRRSSISKNILNKCSDMSIEVKLYAFTTNLPTIRRTDTLGYREVSLPINQKEERDINVSLTFQVNVTEEKVHRTWDVEHIKGVTDIR